MAAATPGGGGGDTTGDSAGGERGLESAASGADSSAPRSPVALTAEARSARAFAAAVLASPAKTSYQWCSSFGGVQLDDEIWEIRFNFLGEDNLERTVSRSDITVLNLLELIKGHGYGIRDGMFYVKEEGRGSQGMEVIDSMAKVEEMLALFENEKILNITVLKKNASWPKGFNMPEGLPLQMMHPAVLAVDVDGINYISEEDEGLFPVAMDCSDVHHLGTQQSSNFQNVQDLFPIHVEIISDDDNIVVEEEVQLVHKLKRKKKEIEPDEEEEEILEQLHKQKKEREDCLLRYEGDTDVEEFFEEDSESDSDVEIAEPEYFAEEKKGKSVYSHYLSEEEDFCDFVPSCDEEQSLSDVGSSDDDGFVKKFKTPGGRNRKLKKLKKRLWYDGSRANPEEQFAPKLCFKDVVEFRLALRGFHIAQLRNFKYRRNDGGRIIVYCTDEGKKQGCTFKITASKIAKEKTFCIRKFRPRHTCDPLGDKTRVTIDWLAKNSVEAIRTDPKTSVDTLIENAKVAYGVEVARSKAYRARRKAFTTVIGDQESQYTRLRDYLQAILDTNPGSRCIVTTKQLVDNPSKNPRFHGLFICLNASKEGFLNGCRPFIGVDGCFIKLSSGQQILAATGRDGNNNIFPIAFGVVDKEDTASWCWFLTQLKYCIGAHGKFGNYTIISDRQKGLLKAISQVFPNSPQRFCLRHIYANFQRAGFRGPELKKHMDAASYSYTKNGFDIAMEALKADCEEAYNWLVQIPPETWARHLFDTNCKTDLVVNNISEVFNRMILDVRNKPVWTMLEGIRNKLMVQFDLNTPPG